MICMTSLSIKVDKWYKSSGVDPFSQNKRICTDRTSLVTLNSCVSTLHLYCATTHCDWELCRRVIPEDQWGQVSGLHGQKHANPVAGLKQRWQ